MDLLVHETTDTHPPYVSVTVFLEDTTKVRAQAAVDLAVSQMTGLGPTQATVTPTLPTTSTESFGLEVTGVALATSPHSQS